MALATGVAARGMPSVEAKGVLACRGLIAHSGRRVRRARNSHSTVAAWGRQLADMGSRPDDLAVGSEPVRESMRYPLPLTAAMVH